MERRPSRKDLRSQLGIEYRRKLPHRRSRTNHNVIILLVINNEVEAIVEFTLKVWQRARVTYYECCKCISYEGQFIRQFCVVV